ncbi:MAG: hypothetical protein U0Z44_09680 [Kouleothrix sp.]
MRSATPRLAGAAPALATRGWAVARERVSGSMRAAAHDMAWVLRATAAQSDLLQLVRHAALSGTLAHLGCTLHPDAPAEASRPQSPRAVRATQH